MAWVWGGPAESWRQRSAIVPSIPTSVLLISRIISMSCLTELLIRQTFSQVCSATWPTMLIVAVRVSLTLSVSHPISQAVSFWEGKCLAALGS